MGESKKCPNLTPFEKFKNYWVERLTETVLSLFKYNNVPRSVNVLYLENTLHTTGRVIWTVDKDNNLRALNGGISGIDCYNFPITGIIANHVLGNWNTTFGVDSILGFNNRKMTPTTPIINHYAEILAHIDTDIYVNLCNLKLTKVFTASNSAQKTKISLMIDEVQKGRFAIIQNNNIMDMLTSDTGITVFSDPTEYIIDKCIKDKRATINEFLTVMGVNNCNIEKRERVIGAEVDANDEEIMLNRRYWLSTREKMCDEVNSMFKKYLTLGDLSVEYSARVEISPLMGGVDSVTSSTE